MKHFPVLGGLVLAAALLAPLALNAQQHDKKYYDRDAKDYHVYNNQEDRAYRAYLGEQHRTYHEFRKDNRSQQQQYFKWRHTHPDNVLFKVEVR